MAVLNLDDPKTQDDLADTLDQLRNDLAEVISLDDLCHHEWLRRIVVAADDINTRTEYRALEWAKCQPNDDGADNYDAEYDKAERELNENKEW